MNDNYEPGDDTKESNRLLAGMVALLITVLSFVYYVAGILGWRKSKSSLDRE